MSPKKSAVLIDLEQDDATSEMPKLTPASAPAVPDLPGAASAGGQGRAMQTAARLAARPPSRLLRLFLASLGTLVMFLAGVAATQFVTDLLVASPMLGLVATALFATVCATALLIAGREWLGYRRLGRLDAIRAQADAASSTGVLKDGKAVGHRIVALYQGRPELTPSTAQIGRVIDEQFEVAAIYDVLETQILSPLDAQAEEEIAAAARQVATVTALVPLALADVIAALTSNLRMIRRIAEIYGGRAGTLGSWRLTRSVLTHLVATGAVAVGDDLIGSVAGGSVLSKVSRRFGEGVVNGALTARVGVAALEVCRPLPFGEKSRPSVTRLVKQALGGLFSNGS